MSGFFVMHRGWRDNPVFRGEFSRGDAWVWLIENACWKPTKFDVKGKTITLERGQLCASRDYLAKVWGWSSSAVERFLTRLQTEQMIGRETGQGKSIISISNYTKYQDVGSQAGQEIGQKSGQRSDRDRTAKEQGNKGTREEEPDGSPSQRAGAPEADEAGSDDLFGEAPEKPKTKRKRDPQEPFMVPDWIPRPEWEGYLEMRAKKGAKPTPRAIELLVGKLEKLRRDGHDPGDVLDQSTTANWTDIYPLKDAANDRRNSGSAYHKQSGWLA